jgi:hypothetical protein
VGGLFNGDKKNKRECSNYAQQGLGYLTKLL